MSDAVRLRIATKRNEMKLYSLSTMIVVLVALSAALAGESTSQPTTQPHKRPLSPDGKPLIEHARVVVFGDSISHNNGRLKFKHWTEALQERFDLDLINAGVGGNTSTQGLARLQSDVISKQPDFVLISFGMNDHVMKAKNQPNVTLETFGQNLTTMVTQIRAAGAVPVFITTNYVALGDPKDKSHNYYYNRHDPALYDDVGGAQAYLDRYIDEMRRVGKQLDVPIADVRKACDEYDPKKFTSDGVHPSELGQSVYAKVVGDLLEQKFGEKENQHGK